jgi:hypothetical protein
VFSAGAPSYRGDRRVARLGESPAEYQNQPTTTVDCDTTTSGCEYMRVKEVVKKDNLINSY